MRLVIFGGRDLDLSIFAIDIWLSLCGHWPAKPGELEVVEGEARGVDVSARRWGEHHSLTVHKYFANWQLYRAAAGPIRNAEMVKVADSGVGFISTEGSKGTANMRDQMIKAKRPLMMIEYNFIEPESVEEYEDF